MDSRLLYVAILIYTEIFSNQLRYGMKTPATATGQKDGDDGVGE